MRAASASAKGTGRSAEDWAAELVAVEGGVGLAQAPSVARLVYTSGAGAGAECDFR